jgi:hypothetical protein
VLNGEFWGNEMCLAAWTAGRIAFQATCPVQRMPQLGEGGCPPIRGTNVGMRWFSAPPQPASYPYPLAEPDPNWTYDEASAQGVRIAQFSMPWGRQARRFHPIPYPRRMSNRPSAAHRLAVLRLALRLTAGVLHTTGYTPEYQRRIVGDPYEAQAWLRIQLAPLARNDWLIRELLKVLDPERPARRWTSPRAAKRELLRLSASARALAAAQSRRVSR